MTVLYLLGAMAQYITVAMAYRIQQSGAVECTISYHMTILSERKEKDYRIEYYINAFVEHIFIKTATTRFDRFAFGSRAEVGLFTNAL